MSTRRRANVLELLDELESIVSTVESLASFKEADESEEVRTLVGAIQVIGGLVVGVRLEVWLAIETARKAWGLNSFEEAAGRALEVLQEWATRGDGDQLRELQASTNQTGGAR